MTGFPNRPNRAAFGPQMVNVRAVQDASKELGADPVNLTFWQAAGAGMVLPLAMVLYNGATPALLQQALAFDPNGVLGPVTVVKSSTGNYAFTFASAYPDETGTAVSFAPKAAMTFVQGAGAQIQAVPTLNGLVVDVAVRDGTNTAVDATVLLLVW